MSALGISTSRSVNPYSPTMNLESVQAQKDEHSTTQKTDNFFRNMLLTGFALNIAGIGAMLTGAVTIGLVSLAGALTCYAVAALYECCFPVIAANDLLGKVTSFIDQIPQKSRYSDAERAELQQKTEAFIDKELLPYYVSLFPDPSQRESEIASAKKTLSNYFEDARNNEMDDESKVFKVILLKICEGHLRKAAKHQEKL